MRARSRRSASNYFSAALLELSVMGIFVVIAQPQLRQGVLELLHPSSAVSDLPQAEQFFTSPHSPTTARLDPGSLTTSQRAPGPELISSSDGWSIRSASYAPLDQYESFSVSIASADLKASAPAGQERVARKPQMATPLEANDWNIAAAAQSPRPLSGWTKSKPVDAEYRDTYPPPFGTQSQWK